MTAAQLVGLIVVGVGIWLWRSARKEEGKRKQREREGWRSFNSTPVRGHSYRSTANNHDHQKRQYRTQDDADRIIARMRSKVKTQWVPYVRITLLIMENGLWAMDVDQSW